MRLRFAVLSALVFVLPAAASAQHKHELTVAVKTADGKDAGTAVFHQKKDGTLNIKLDLKNLPAGEHGVHIHQNPVCDAPDFKTAGGHFNPDSKKHGYQNPDGHHNGDLPQNVTVAADGTGHARFDVKDLSMGSGKPDDIIASGTSIMVHAGPDDMKTDPSGNSGGRIACGVIVKQ